MSKTIDPDSAMRMATEIVVAYLGNGSLQAEQLPGLVREVIAAFEGREAGASSQALELVESSLAPTVKLAAKIFAAETVTADWIICLEDGKRYKSLKRHLKAKYGMTPDDYRRKWGLPDDYPMVAPNYSKHRSELARQIGFSKASVPPARQRA